MQHINTISKILVVVVGLNAYLGAVDFNALDIVTMMRLNAYNVL